MVPIRLAFPLSLLLLRAGLDRPGGTHMARVALVTLRWLHVLFLASLLFVHFACSSWPSCALRGLSLRRVLTGNYAEKNAYF